MCDKIFNGYFHLQLREDDDENAIFCQIIMMKNCYVKLNK